MRKVGIQLAILCCLLVFAQQGAKAQWVQTAGPYNYFVSSLLTSGSNLYVLAHWVERGRMTEGLFRSSDKGLSWDSLLVSSRDSVYIREVTVNNTGVYCLLWNELVRSTDDGATWSRFPIPSLPKTSFTGDGFTVKGSQLFVATEEGVLRTSDNGLNWYQANSGLESVGTVNMFVVDGSEMYVATDAGMYSTSDDGTTWRELNSSWRNTNVMSLVAHGPELFAGTYGGGVYHSTNRGQQWKAVNSDLANGEINCLVMNDTRLYAGTGGGIFLTTDRGTTWSFASSRIPERRVTILAVAGADLYCVTQNNGVFGSTDDGLTWTAASPVVNSPAFVWTFAGTSSALLAGYDGGVFRTTNDGMSWKPAGFGLRDFYVWDLTTDGTQVFAATRGGVYRSTDDGLSWIECNREWRNTSVWAVAASGRYLFAGTSGGGVYRSTDNGATWKRVNSGLDDFLFVRAFAVSGTNLFVMTTGGVYVTDSNGERWVRIPGWNDDDGGWCLVSTGSALLAGGKRGISVSTFDGFSWSAFRSSKASLGLVTSFTFKGDKLFASYFAGDSVATHPNGGIYLSSDNGLSWEPVGADLPEYWDGSRFVTTGVLVAEIYGDHLFASTEHGGVWSRPLADLIPLSALSVAQRSANVNLVDNFPNPFNPSTTITYRLPFRGHVRLTIFNLLGQQVEELANEEAGAGYYVKQWKASGSSGPYFYRLEAVSVDDPSKRFVGVKKMILLK